MPCDTVVTNKVDMGKMQDDLARKAVEDIGGVYSTNQSTFTVDGVRYKIEDGKLWSIDRYSSRTEAIADKIKAAYSARVVMTAAQKFGWTVTKTGNKIHLNRRG